MLKSLFMALRPKTLGAAVIPVLLGHSLVLSEGFTPLTWVTVCALCGALCIQIATNLLNDAIDFTKGADTEHRLGPKRVTQSGLMPARTVMLLGFGFLVLALLLGLPLAWRGGWPIVLIGVVSLFLAYGYTGGPWPLAYLGLGDLFVFLFFGLVSVAGTFYIHTLTLIPEVALVGLEAGCLATVLIAINNLRDIDTDRTANKNTLAVRFGEQAVRIEIVVLCLLSYLSISAFDDRPWVWLVLMATPLAVIIMHNSLTTRGAALNKTLALAGAQQWLFGLALCIGLIIR